MYSCNQEWFNINKNSCWLASALNWAANNISHNQITKEDMWDLEEYCENIHPIPMPEGWLNLSWGLKRTAARLIYKYNIPAKARFFDWWTNIFDMFLDQGYVISVSIKVSEAYKKLRRSGKKIQWDFTNEPAPGGHVFCLFRKDWIDYILNSWDPETNVREVDLNTKWLFKKWTCGILY